MNVSDLNQSYVTFIAYDEPALQPGQYEIEVKQAVQIQGSDVSPGVPDTSLLFSVTGERFSFDAADIESVFPADLATGEFSEILPHVVFNRRTLPWERKPGGSPASTAPWLAVLLLNEDEMSQITLSTQSTAKDLVSSSVFLSTYDAQGNTQPTQIKGTLPGTDPSNKGLSYPHMEQLDYGESPDTPCTTIDIPTALFNQIAPSLSDLPYLAHAREVDTTNSEDTTEQQLQRSIVICNRLSKSNTNSSLFLVSLEDMGPYLPQDDGTGQIPDGTTFVRLVVFRSWKFFANDNDGLLEPLLENLVPKSGVSSLQYYAGSTPNESDVQQALANQAAGTLTDQNAKDLLCNALGLGYVPLPHHMRHGDQSVSWYRGPLVPCPVAHNLQVPLPCPDAANRYNPQTGMFDVSYSAAWQLGQLLALQNASFASALYNWKKAVSESEILAEEQALLEQKLVGVDLFAGLLERRAAKLQTPQVPDEVINWIAKLKLLNGVPFNYLVPDESMLPPESMRFFYLDLNWVDALVDGAFSIGRTNKTDVEKDAEHLSSIHKAVMQRVRELRPNARPAGLKEPTNDPEVITGLLLRSKAVSGWPRLIINGYASTTTDSPCLIYKMARLAPDALICFFEGNVAKVDIHEPPEQLHFGVEEIEGHAGNFTTGLRVITKSTYPPPPSTPLNPGQQLPDPPSPVLITTRLDQQTMQVSKAAEALCSTLNTTYNQGLTLGTSFTSAEFAIQMVKGVVQVEFQLPSSLSQNLNPSSNKERVSYAN